MTVNNHGKWKENSNWSEPKEVVGLSSRPAAKREVAVPDGIGVAEYKIATMTREDLLRNKALDKLSPARREAVEDFLYKKTAGGGGEPSPVVAGGSKSGLYKEASGWSDGSMGGGQGTGGVFMGRGDTTHLMPNLYSPLWLTANLQLPRDRATGNAWNRAFYDTNPVVHNAVNLHSTYPLARMVIKCKDKKIEQFYMDMADQVDLFRVVQMIANDYWKLGECFPYASLNEHTGMWDKIYLHNPDFVLVQETLIPGQHIIALKPNPKLRKIVESNDPALVNMRAQMHPQMLDAISRNEYIPLDTFNISHLKNSSSDYEVHGQSIIQSVWKDLVLWDLFRENKFVQADGMVNPMTLVKVGTSNPDGQYPTKEYLTSVRDLFEEAQYNKDFKLFTGDNVSVERVGYNGGILDVTGDLNMILDNIFIGLMVPKSLMTQEGATYATASVALDVIRQRYENFRSTISNWLIRKIFAPIAEINKFYEYDGGKKRLILPEIEWNRMTLYDVDSYIGHLKELMDKQPTDKPGGVSRTTVYRSLGLDFKDELANIKREAIDLEILAKEMTEIKKLSLSELRSLDPSKPLTESIEQEAPLPGADMPGGPLPDLGGLPPMPEGGLPDLGAPPGGAEPPLPPSGPG
jgi:hypothetical protein